MRGDVESRNRCPICRSILFDLPLPEPIDLENFDLENIGLESVHLENVYLENVHLRNVHLEDLDLRNINLENEDRLDLQHLSNMIQTDRVRAAPTIPRRYAPRAAARRGVSTRQEERLVLRSGRRRSVIDLTLVSEDE